MDPSWEPHAPTYQVHENTISALLVVHVHGDAEVKADDAPTGQTGPVGGELDVLNRDPKLGAILGGDETIISVYPYVYDPSTS